MRLLQPMFERYTTIPEGFSDIIQPLLDGVQEL